MRPHCCRRRVALRVTFDTNTLDPITQPELAGPMRADCRMIHEFLRAKRLQGFFCETVLTIEGGQKSPQPRPDTVARVRRALELGLRILRHRGLAALQSMYSMASFMRRT